MIKNFSSIMRSCQGYANNLKTTLTGGLGFGAMAAIGGKAMSLVTNSVSDLSKETIETSDSMYKLQAAMKVFRVFRSGNTENSRSNRYIKNICG